MRLAVALLTVLAAGRRDVRASAWLVPLADLEGYVVGAELGASGPPGVGQLRAAAGWGLETGRWHYRLAAVEPLSPASELELGWADWADVTLLGQAREQGLAGQLVWEPTVGDRWSLRIFSGRVGTRPDELASGVLYGHVRYDSWRVQRWPVSVRLRAAATYGQAEPPSGRGGRGGPFGAVAVTVPVQVEYLRLIARAGYAAGEQALAGFTFHLGGYGDGWLRGYGPGEVKSPLLLGLNAEYRRAWVQSAAVPLLSLIEAGPFVDVMAEAKDGASLAGVAWKTSYGLTAAVPLGITLVGMDIAWNDAGRVRTAARVSGEF